MDYFLLTIIILLSIAIFILFYFYKLLRDEYKDKLRVLENTGKALTVQTQKVVELEKEMSPTKIALDSAVYNIDTLKKNLDATNYQLQREIKNRDAMVETQISLWRNENEQRIRDDAVAKSKSVVTGRVVEELAPHFPNFPYNPKDMHFIGAPIDYIVFKGLDAGNIEDVVILEVKSGKSQLNTRERQIRNAIANGRVKYEIYKLE